MAYSPPIMSILLITRNFKSCKLGERVLFLSTILLQHTETFEHFMYFIYTMVNIQTYVIVFIYLRTNWFGIIYKWNKGAFIIYIIIKLEVQVHFNSIVLSNLNNILCNKLYYYGLVGILTTWPWTNHSPVLPPVPRCVADAHWPTPGMRESLFLVARDFQSWL